MVSSLLQDSSPRCPVARLLHHGERPYDFDLHFSIDAVNVTLWNSIVHGRNPFLSWEFLKAQEEGNRDNIRHWYAVLWDDRTPLGVALFQVTRFQGKPITELLTDKGAMTQFMAKRLGFLHERISRKIILCGNAFTTGQDAYLFTKACDPGRGIATVCAIIQHLEKHEGRDEPVAGVVVKDFPHTTWPESSRFLLEEYTALDTEPAMVMVLDESWTSIDDYRKSLVSKFRVKAKRAGTKSVSLIMISMTAEMIEDQIQRLHVLHAQVMDRCQYQTGSLDVRSLKLFKQAFPEQYRVDGYFLNDNLVGFKTSFWGNDTLWALNVGVDYTLNQEHAIYERMLYDFVAIGIERRTLSIHFGRTASEIKSSVGASPVPIKCYIRHTNPLLNLAIKGLARRISPPAFSVRTPFQKNWYSLNSRRLTAIQFPQECP
ncbi:GNAT family N-acetyltransferase [Myxococcota bacterium]|nr:GNAT family N-acetyltransferase [Myxococcota bacterium]